MKKTLFAMMLAGAVVMSPAALTAFAAENTAAAAEEDGQNPIMNYIGLYGAGRPSINVQADGMDGAAVEVTWGSSAFEHSEWKMSGTFDPETATISYSNCVKQNFTFENETDPGTSETVYENGTGTITFHDENGLSLTWQDDMENAAQDMDFAFAFTAGEDEDIASGDIAGSESSVAVSTETELTNGALTIRLSQDGESSDAFHWEAYTGDKGDASLFELLTQSDMEEGYAYVGSFRALEGESGEDTIRLVHTNGDYVDQYMDFDITVKDGAIVAHTGGSHTFPTTAEDFLQLIGGEWTEKKNPGMVMDISLGTGGGLDVVISSGSGRDGMTGFYTLTMYYDALKEAFIYTNGAEHTAAITDEEEAMTEEITDSTDGQSGYLFFEPEAAARGELAISWVKPEQGGETFCFVQE